MKMYTVNFFTIAAFGPNKGERIAHKYTAIIRKKPRTTQHEALHKYYFKTDLYHTLEDVSNDTVNCIAQSEREAIESYFESNLGAHAMMECFSVREITL